jgi:hypothetical protein
VGEGHGSLVLVNAGEHFQKYILRKVFLRDPPRQMGPDDPDDEGMEVVDKLPRSCLIALANAIKTASQIKRLVVRHRFMEASSSTFCKTPIAQARLPRPLQPANAIADRDAAGTRLRWLARPPAIPLCHLTFIGRGR